MGFPIEFRFSHENPFPFSPPPPPAPNDAREREREREVFKEEEKGIERDIKRMGKIKWNQKYPNDGGGVVGGGRRRANTEFEISKHATSDSRPLAEKSLARLAPD